MYSFQGTITRSSFVVALEYLTTHHTTCSIMPFGSSLAFQFFVPKLGFRNYFAKSHNQSPEVRAPIRFPAWPSGSGFTLEIWNVKVRTLMQLLDFTSASGFCYYRISDPTRTIYERSTVRSLCDASNRIRRNSSPKLVYMSKAYPCFTVLATQKRLVIERLVCKLDLNLVDWFLRDSFKKIGTSGIVSRKSSNSYR